nr:DUF6452 family protein [uncultured Flavobacterium sp.]
MNAKLFFIVLLAFSLSNCEKDDICAESTPTTPKVVIEFYDAANPTTAKNVSNLLVTSPDFTKALNPFSGTNKIKVPLKTFQDNTVLHFIQNGGTTVTTDDNLDSLTFNYTRATSYVSRACGFKTLFTLQPTSPVVLTPDSNNWIQNIVVVQSYIANETETHVKIYF